MKDFGGPVLFLDRIDINTDELIPAKYLTEIEKQALKPHLLEDLKLEGFDPQRDTIGKNVIISRSNFGCGSSREHAPWVLEANGINLVVAESFARIFRQNMYNCGMMAVELSAEAIGHIFEIYSQHETILFMDPRKSQLKLSAEVGEELFEFSIPEFDYTLVEAGGWVDYADRHY